MMDPTSAAYLGAAGISAGGSLLGSLLGIGNQKSVIKAQQRMQREAMQWQSSERKATQDYNTDMWNKQNEYNSASAQRGRLEEAGLNPYMMMSGGDAGSASSVTGSYTGAPSSPNYQAFDIGGNVQQAFRQIGDQLYNMQLNKSQVEKNKSETAKAQADALLSAALTNDSNTFRAQKLANLEWQGREYESTIHLQEEEKNLKHAQYLYQNMDNEAKRIMNKYLDAEKQAQLFGLLTSINEAYTRMELNRAKAKEAMAGAFNMYMGGRVSQGELKVLESTMQGTIDKMNAQNAVEAKLMLGELQAGSEIGFSNLGRAKFGSELWQNRTNREFHKTLYKLSYGSGKRESWKPFLHGTYESLSKGKLPFMPGLINIGE